MSFNYDLFMGTHDELVEMFGDNSDKWNIVCSPSTIFFPGSAEHIFLENENVYYREKGVSSEKKDN